MKIHLNDQGRPACRHYRHPTTLSKLRANVTCRSCLTRLGDDSSMRRPGVREREPAAMIDGECITKVLGSLRTATRVLSGIERALHNVNKTAMRVVGDLADIRDTLGAERRPRVAGELSPPQHDALDHAWSECRVLDVECEFLLRWLNSTEAACSDLLGDTRGTTDQLEQLQRIL